MRPGRLRFARRVGAVAILSLVALNAWLVALNLAKHDRLPFEASWVPGVEEAAEGSTSAGGRDDEAPGEGEREPAEPAGEEGSTELLTDDAPLPAGGAVGVDVDDGWPGGRGPVPDGPPEPRRVLLTDKGDLLVVGSAPAWTVVTDLADLLARESGFGPLRVLTQEVTWHPEASDQLDDVAVIVERPLLYDAGEIGLPDSGQDVIDPLVELLRADREASVVVIAHIDDLGDTDENTAVALARATAVADRLVADGIERERVQTSVAPADPDALAGDDDLTRRFNRRVELHIENLLKG